MLAKKKEEMSKRRKKRKDIDIINDNDDLIDVIIGRMKTVAEVRVVLNYLMYYINEDFDHNVLHHNSLGRYEVVN